MYRWRGFDHNAKMRGEAMMKRFLFLVIILMLVLASCSGHAHSFTGDVIHEDGAYYQLCECGEGRAHEHLFEETVITAPSCVSDGEAKYTCVVCKAEETRRLERMSENGHDVYLYERIEPTCAKEGKEIYYCKACGKHIEDKWIPKLEHTVTAIEEKPSTCIQNGEGAHSVCSVCEAFVTEKKTLPKSEHTFKDGYCTVCSSSELMKELGYRNDGSIACPGNPAISEIVIPYYSPNGTPVVEIADFQKNRVITSVVFQANAKLPEEAFKDCEKLKTVVLAKDMSVIPTSAFQWCKALESVEIPLGVETIGNMAFTECGSLESIEFPDTVKEIGEYAFSHCASLKSVVLPKNLTTLSYQAFADCESLESVTVSKNTRVLGKYCFKDCPKLKTIYYEGTMEQWGMVVTKDAFFGDTDIERIVCSDGTIEA